MVRYTPGKEIQMVRNPNRQTRQMNWRPAYLDSIHFEEGFSDTASASRKILSGWDLVNARHHGAPDW